MKRRYFALAVVVPVLALLLPLQPAVGAGDDGDAGTSEQQLPAVDGIRFSPEEMAESYKLEAQAEWQPAAGRVATEIRDLYPDAFVAARSTFTTFTVVFAAAAPDGALPLLDAVPVDVEIIEGVGVPEVAVLELVDSITKTVVPLAAPSQGFSIYPDPEKKSVEVDLYPVAGMERADVPLSEFETAVRAAIAQLDARGVVVSVSARETPGGVDDTSYGQAGGTPLNLSSNGAAACTSGFVVKDNKGPDLGAYTSAHLPQQFEAGEHQQQSELQLRLPRGAPDKGDSGGPAYVGTTAVGLMKGWDAINDRSWFSTTDWAMLNLSTHICIDGTSC